MSHVTAFVLRFIAEAVLETVPDGARVPPSIGVMYNAISDAADDVES